MDTTSCSQKENENSKVKNVSEVFTTVNDVNTKYVLNEQYAKNNVNVSSTVQLSSLSSSCSEEATSSLPNPPDGGWGWVVVFASFMISLIADGISLSFGILFVDLEQYFGEGKSKTSWVGSIFLSMPLLAGPIASYLSDRYGCQKVCIAGALLATVAFIVSVCANSLEILFITFSIAGLGLALCYVTSIVIVAYYFEKKRSLATGLSACGTGIGTFVFPPLIMYLLGEYGWRGTLLILSGFFLNMVIFGALMRDLEFPSKDCSSSAKHNSSNCDSTNENCPLEDSERLCSSLVQLPTYLCDNLPVEVISELSRKEGGYLNSLLEQHPYLLNSIVIGNEKDSTAIENNFASNNKEIPNIKNKIKESQPLFPEKCASSLTRNEPSFPVKLDAAYLHNMRMQRGSITYRGAMLNIRRYRLRASSCPDMYRNSLVTISENKTCTFFQDLKELLVDMFDFSIFKNLQYSLFCLSNFLLYACVDVPYVYIPDHAFNQGVDLESASFLISILGVLNTLGLVIVGYVGDKPRIDSSLLYSGFIIISGLMLVIVPMVNQYYGLASLVGIYGFTISANYTLIPIIIVDLISLDCFTGAYGLLLLVQGIASLIGPPIAGSLFDLTGDYYITFVCTGICIFVSGAMIFPYTKTLHFKKKIPSDSSEKPIKQNSETKEKSEEKIDFLDGENNVSLPHFIEGNNDNPSCNYNDVNNSYYPKEKNGKMDIIVPPESNVNIPSITVTENHTLLICPRHTISSIYENPFSSE